MKKIISLIVLVAAVLLFTVPGAAGDNKYVGVSACKMCHQSKEKGDQYGVWKKTKHAEAYTALTTPKAIEIAKKKGLAKAAVESAECLECHIIKADAKMVEKTFSEKDGVQCESCHGAGSAYKTMTIMKDKAKAIAAGLTDFKDQATIEKYCKTCHNEKSPTFKEFKFKEMWDKIKHPNPKKST